MLLVSALGLAAVIFGSPIGTPADGNDVELPAAIASHIPKNIRGYFVVFLLDPPTGKEMPQELFLQHQAYLRQQIEAGTVKLAGPVTDGGRIRGIKIVSAATAEQARAVAEGDPAVKAGVFAVEVHSAMFPSLSGLKIEYSAKK